MPFVKGNQLGKANLGRKKESKKTIWLMESLQEHGYNYEAMLVGFLQKAAKGDRLALDMAHLLVKMVPHMANAPKQDVGQTMIETLVINRFDSSGTPRLYQTGTPSDEAGKAVESIEPPAVDAEIIQDEEHNA
jgi:hypothetical protein